jgi:CDP-glucose 4,6-dehydratase
MVQQVVVASSDKAYGTQPVLPYTEEQSLIGRHPYDVSKSCTDLIAQSYYHTYGLPVAITRCGNIYGGGDLHWSRIVPGTIRALLRGERPIIRSDGSFVRDYIYVEDVARAYVCVAESLEGDKARGEAFNISTESPISAVDLVRAIQSLMDRDDIEPDIRSTARAEIHSQYLSAAKARSVLGWHPHFSLEEGLTATIAWYRRFFGINSELATAVPSLVAVGNGASR